MKIKTSELTGAALDWAVAKCEGCYNFDATGFPWDVDASNPNDEENGATWFTPSTNWAQGGPIIERENISVLRLDDEDIPDVAGFWTGKKVTQWAAVVGDRHSPEQQYGGQGDDWGQSYHVDSDAMCGATPLIAAMRCYVASKLGDTIDIPEGITA